MTYKNNDNLMEWEALEAKYFNLGFVISFSVVYNISSFSENRFVGQMKFTN